MQDQKSSAQNYALAHTPKEIQRLLIQGQLLNPFTRQMLEDAGLTSGMQVLDVGCGPGDVSLIAAELVGETGSVLGVDANADVLQLARARAQAADLSNVSFLAGDIRSLPLDQHYDAIVGRFILQHLPERATLLRRLATHLRPGGIVAFQEYDLPNHTDAFYPPSPLWEQAYAWIMDAFQRAGVEHRMGMSLHSTFLAAGLPAPRLRYEAAIGSRPEWLGYELMAETVRATLPLILKFGIATAEEADIETLADRLRAENSRQQGIARLPAHVSAWVRIN